MNKHFYKLAFCLLPFVLSYHGIIAQDIHFTNFGFSPLNNTPALTGVFNGDIRGTGNYRQQWGNYSDLVSYTTFGASGDMKLFKPDADGFNPWRGGIMLNYDNAGWSHLQNIGIVLAASYGLPITQNDLFTLGVSGGYNQRAFRTSDLTWDDQYADKQYNSSIVSRDVGIFDQSINYLDLNVGANIHHQYSDPRGALDVGVGVFHLNKPTHTFNSTGKIGIDMRYSITATTNVPVSHNFDLLGDVLYQSQGPHTDFVGGLGARLYLQNRPTKLFALQVGVAIRPGDAFSPQVGLLYNNWKVALNFDSNFSNFKAASNRLGGPEINVMYIFAKVKPAKYCPLCPITL